MYALAHSTHRRSGRSLHGNAFRGHARGGGPADHAGDARPRHVGGAVLELAEVVRLGPRAMHSAHTTPAPTRRSQRDALRTGGRAPSQLSVPSSAQSVCVRVMLAHRASPHNTPWRANRGTPEAWTGRARATRRGRTPWRRRRRPGGAAEGGGAARRAWARRVTCGARQPVAAAAPRQHGVKNQKCIQNWYQN